MIEPTITKSAGVLSLKTRRFSRITSFAPYSNKPPSDEPIETSPAPISLVDLTSSDGCVQSYVTGSSETCNPLNGAPCHDRV